MNIKVANLNQERKIRRRKIKILMQKRMTKRVNRKKANILVLLKLCKLTAI